jgi:hypothetical protein
LRLRRHDFFFPMAPISIGNALEIGLYRILDCTRTLAPQHLRAMRPPPVFPGILAPGN